jgi:hypothetical protein
VESEFRGFAFEGAAMGLVIADFLHPFSAFRFQSFNVGATPTVAIVTAQTVGLANHRKVKT